MLTAIELENFKGHVHTRVELSPSRFTLLVGDNASGKSSVLEAVHLSGRLLAERPADVFFGPNDLNWLQRTPRSEALRVCLFTQDDNERGRFSWFQDRAQHGEVAYEFSAHERTDATNGSNGPYAFEGLANQPWRRPAQRHSPFEGCVFLRLSASAIARASYSDDLAPSIRADGSGLATFLKEMKVNDASRFDAWLGAGRQVVPTLRSASFVREELSIPVQRRIEVDGRAIPYEEQQRRVGDALRLQFADSDLLPASAASEGTLIVLALLSFFFVEKPVRVLLLDDIDRALHPRAQEELVTVLRQLLEQHPETQIIATTHSPYLVDCFEPEEVVVLGRPDGSRITARTLSDHPNKALLKTLNTGEFLAASGKEWFGR